MQMRPISIPKRLSPEKEVPKPNSKPVKMGLEGGGCPFGTVPIRRTSKDDLLRTKLHSEMYASKIDRPTGTHNAADMYKLDKICLWTWFSTLFRRLVESNTQKHFSSLSLCDEIKPILSIFFLNVGCR